MIFVLLSVFIVVYEFHPEINPYNLPWHSRLTRSCDKFFWLNTIGCIFFPILNINIYWWSAVFTIGILLHAYSADPEDFRLAPPRLVHNRDGG